ncbi:MAG: S-adenosylmethionine synthetase N-terminal domain-containing protein [Bullifex sp.]|nr:S-adenosylmethionine synthetase N-terminal domain-containing protein [Treponema sp.]MDY3851024.1 S-adenosylmethionine synthetase N-terminal domain-containing protein [Bullifex sp.]MDY4798987.1 S-adenosylmethionine synthetase N-terminal domain-containing protein [Bullifex sp.]
MFEKVNPEHPDKKADRIAGALVDMAYRMEENPRIAAEVMLGHGRCVIIAETSVHLDVKCVSDAVRRIAGEGIRTEYEEHPQDAHLALNQEGMIRCGDNGIFRGFPVTEEQKSLTDLARRIHSRFPHDGKYVSDGRRTIICQSNADDDALLSFCPGADVNPIGFWTGGTDADTGAVNRKLGSDMGDSVTGGGLHGKDLSKADVSVNIHAFLKARRTGRPVELSCAIGDETVDGIPYVEIVEEARRYIASLGGFEKFAEWGLIR